MKNEKKKKNLSQIILENVLQQCFIIIIIIISSLLCTRDNMIVQIFMGFLRGMIKPLNDVRLDVKSFLTILFIPLAAQKFNTNLNDFVKLSNLLYFSEN